MRISFDLDDTLICHRRGSLHEPRPPWYRRLLAPEEPLRRGAGALIRTLQADGWEVWVYTTSHRPPASVRWWLWSYGLRVDEVINQMRHAQHLGRSNAGGPSKNPAAFGIDLHVDDSDGVRIEGERHHFRVLVVSPTDPLWADLVLAAARAIQTESLGSLADARNRQVIAEWE